MNKNELKGGIIPVFVNEDEKIIMLFMKPSNGKFGGKKFQIAKGRVEENENTLEGAIRETQEELGLRKNNIVKIKKCGVFGNMHIYGALVKNYENKFYDETTHETAETAWMELEDFLETGRDDHKHIVRKCFNIFKELLY